MYIDPHLTDLYRHVFYWCTQACIIYPYFINFSTHGYL